MTDHYEMRYDLSRLNRWRQPFCYAIIGALGTVIHFGTLFLLVEFAGFMALTASTIGFVITVLVSYLLNYYWTFSATSDHRGTFLRYLTVSCTGLMLNTLIMWLGLSLLELHYGYAQLLVVLVIPASNYLMNRFWTFTQHDTAPTS